MSKVKKIVEAPAKPSARPFLKWAGGKTQLLAELAARIPKTWDASRDLYVEPFVGAGALFFHLRPARALLGDSNPDLTACWTALRDEPAGLRRQLGALQRRYRLAPKETFYEVRAWKPATLDTVTRAARLIMLNKAGFNGIYRVNKAGDFNVPWGHNPKVTLLDWENLEACSELLLTADVTVQTGDFSLLEGFPPGTLAYLDPPYAPVSKTSNFTFFTKEKFRKADQVRLADHAARLVKQGCHVIVSQSADEEVAELYRARGFTCDLVAAIRKINSKGAGRGPVGEYIIHQP